MYTPSQCKRWGLGWGLEMATRTTNKLTDRQVKTLKTPGMHSDGRGLYLLIDGERRSWMFMYKIAGKRRELGLGSARDYSLAEVRSRADICREAIKTGADPKVALSGNLEIPTFGDAVQAYLATMQSSWRNDKHRAQWAMTLGTYAKPMHRIAVDKVTSEHVLGVLKPIWRTIPETAQRLRGRIENVLDSAYAQHGIELRNPARWRGHLEKLLPARQKLARGHHKAMAIDALPTFMRSLKERQALSALALEFVILTACRTTECIEARWAEVNIDKALWTIPAHRMKASREHRVPLCERAIAILQSVALIRTSEYVFPGGKKGKPLSNMAMATLLNDRMGVDVTVHGFRSTFRDWCAERTSFPHELAEMALAHTVSNVVERAYRRGDMFDKRCALMTQWAAFCEQVPEANIVPFKRA